MGGCRGGVTGVLDYNNNQRIIIQVLRVGGLSSGNSVVVQGLS